MKFNMIVKKSEIDEAKSILETINNILPEELEFKMPSAKDLLRLEDGRYLDEEKYGYLLITEDHGDYEITVNLTEEFTVDIMSLLNKIIMAAAPIVGAVVGFAGTMKVLGGKFIKKLTDLGEKFSEKWFISQESTLEDKNVEEEMKYGVYPLIFNWTDTAGIEHWEHGAVVLEKVDDGYDIVKSKCEEIHNDTGWITSLKEAETQLITEIEARGLEPVYNNITDATAEMLRLYDRLQPEKKTFDTPIEDAFESFDDLEKAINERKKTDGEEDDDPCM